MLAVDLKLEAANSTEGNLYRASKDTSEKRIEMEEIICIS